MIRHYSKSSSRSSGSSCNKRSSTRRRIRSSFVSFGILLVGLLFVLSSLLITTLPSAVVVATAITASTTATITTEEGEVERVSTYSTAEVHQVVYDEQQTTTRDERRQHSKYPSTARRRRRLLRNRNNYADNNHEDNDNDNAIIPTSNVDYYDQEYVIHGEDKVIDEDYDFGDDEDFDKDYNEIMEESLLEERGEEQRNLRSWSWGSSSAGAGSSSSSSSTTTNRGSNSNTGSNSYLSRIFARNRRPRIVPVSNNNGSRYSFNSGRVGGFGSGIGNGNGNAGSSTNNNQGNSNQQIYYVEKPRRSWTGMYQNIIYEPSNNRQSSSSSTSGSGNTSPSSVAGNIAAGEGNPRASIPLIPTTPPPTFAPTLSNRPTVSTCIQ